MEFQVALCGLTDHKAHLVQVVIGSARGAKYKFHVGQPESLAWVDIAVVETMSSVSAVLLAEVRRRNPKAVAIFVSDHGLSGESRFRIARRSLLLQIQQLLEQVVDEAILSDKSPAASPPPVAREPAPVPPRNVTPIVAAPVQAAPAPGVQLPRPLVALVVDDSASVREQARAALQRAGITSKDAPDAEHAMTLLGQQTFDLALFDVVMPGVDGYELCRRVKHDPRTRNMPVLMLTSRSSPFDRARGALVGCDSYLIKPIAWDKFFAAIDKALSKVFKNDRQAMAARGFRIYGGGTASGASAPAMKAAT